MFAVARFNATIETYSLKWARGGEGKRLAWFSGRSDHCCALSLTSRSFSGHCLHCVSLLDYFPCGIGADHFNPLYDVLIVAGWAEQTGSFEGCVCIYFSKGRKLMALFCAGSPLISCWRLLQDSPYWVPAPGQEVKKVSQLILASLYDLEPCIFLLCWQEKRSTMRSLFGFPKKQVNKVKLLTFVKFFVGFWVEALKVVLN